MAAQAAAIASTIAGMQRVIARSQYSSDSDEPYLQPSNRDTSSSARRIISPGHHQAGRRDRKPPIEKINHAGYNRAIVRRNPKRYDQDGDELDDDEEDEEADAQAAEENPYSDIKLESLLSPLTSAAGLPEHPSLPATFLSRTLTDMARNACEMVQRERKSLCNAKKLLTNFRGDEAWIPCGLLATPEDEAIFDTERVYRKIVSGEPIIDPGSNRQNGHRSSNGSMNSDTLRHTGNNPKLDLHGNANGVSNNDDEGLEAGIIKDAVRTIGEDQTSNTVKGPTMDAKKVNGTEELEMADTQDDVANNPKPTYEEPQDEDKALEDEIVGIVGPDISITGQQPAREGTEQHEADHKVDSSEWEPRPAPSDDNINPLNNDPTSSPTSANPAEQILESIPNPEPTSPRPSPRRMRTRAQAQAVTDPTPSSTLTQSPSHTPSPPPTKIHPLFLIPPTAQPDPNYGLPPQEAEETRRMLQAYVQKQEEVCRCAEKLYEGLLRVERQRKSVWEWCKAEKHVGEMSDGEDWYDMEAWGLDAPLRKGMAEDEEEAGAAGGGGGKKTRGRRA